MKEEEKMLVYGADDFTIASAREVRLEHVTVQATADGLARGTILANAGDGSYAALSETNVAKAEVILAEDVAAGTEKVVAPVYVSGDFVENGLKAGVELTAAAKLNLKNAGIYLVNGVTA